MLRAGLVGLVLVGITSTGGQKDCSLPTQPGPPITAYVSGSCQRHESTVPETGMRYWTYRPDVWRNEDSAPVVVYLHGGMCNKPEIYEAHLLHLCRQGIIVIFPQFNKDGPEGAIQDLLVDADHRKYLNRAIRATDEALAELEQEGQIEAITLYGHSAGGILALAWTEAAWSPSSIVLANANPDPIRGIPAPFAWMVNVTGIDWRSAANSTRCPVVLLCGEQDHVAPCSDDLAIYEALGEASSKVVYRLAEDGRGRPPVRAHHMAPISDAAWLPDWITNVLGAGGEVDAADTRFYWAALDAVLRNDYNPALDMGTWSNGEPLHPVTQLAPLAERSR